MKKYKEFLVFTEPFNPEIVSSVMWELKITGVNEEENFLKIFSDGEDVNLDEISNLLSRLKDEQLISNFRIEENSFEYKNWNEEWEKNTNVIKVSDSIIIKPTFREYVPAGNETVILIDPKMSFGTGEHQTTKLSLVLLEKYIKPGFRVLDAGTGTGVLAIAAVKFGADYALGIDIDEWAVPNFEENAKLNNTAGKTEVRNCTLGQVDEKDFDLAAANIQKNVLIEICGDLHSILKKEGILILSGLLLADEGDIMEKYISGGFEFIEMQQMDEWIAVVLKKL